MTLDPTAMLILYSGNISDELDTIHD